MQQNNGRIKNSAIKVRHKNLILLSKSECNIMVKIAFFDTKSYDRIWFDKLNTKYEIVYLESKLNSKTAQFVKDFDVVCAFVNDNIDSTTIETLANSGIKLIAMRCAGYNNIDFKSAFGKIHIVRVPAYSPYAVAEHAMALLQTLNRKIHKAYNRTREFNFSLEGLIGMDLYQKTVGVIGTGKIGRIFIDICRGFGMKVIAYDLYPVKDSDIEYVPLERLFKESDIISLHCPLTEQTHHILNRETFAMMKKGVFIINTSRGTLINSADLLNALNNEIVKGAGLDVYEEESEFFFEDFSEKIVKDKILSLLVSRPNVIITSHQAFLTDEALKNIAATTLNNIDEFIENKPLTNEVRYECNSN